MDKNLIQFAVDLVKTQASVKVMSGDEVESALIRYYNVLHKIHKAEMDMRMVEWERGSYVGHGLEKGSPFGLDPKSSIAEDKVTCLECGGEFRQLTANHLRTHHLTPRDYKKKWGFPLKQPLAAKKLTSLRSRSAKKRGLPKKLQEYLDERQHRKLVVDSRVS